MRLRDVAPEQRRVLPLKRRCSRSSSSRRHVRQASLGLDHARGRARTPRSAEHSRWSTGKALSFVPLRTERVVEVRYEHMEGPRVRHTTQLVRLAPDRDPCSCTDDRLQEPCRFDLSEVLGS